MIKNLQPRLAEIGKIKIGKKSSDVRKSTTGKEYRLPQKIDYFVITKIMRNGDNDFEIDNEVMSKVGAKPTELNIMFLYDDIEKNFKTSYALYAGRTCKCRGDGEWAIRNNKDGSREQISCPCNYLEGVKVEGKLAQCKPTGILVCILEKAQRIGGVYVFRTHSWNSIRNILSSMAFIRQLTGSILAGIPLKLTLKPQSVQPKNNARSLIVYVANIEFEGDWKALRETAVKIAKIRGTTQMEIEKYRSQIDRYLQTPESPEDEEQTNIEFSPETVDIKEPFKQPEKVKEEKKEDEDRDIPSMADQKNSEKEEVKPQEPVEQQTQEGSLF